jgi:peptidoglycan/xylan/chitin deacetylase (PgdA/CDA1 family)
VVQKRTINLTFHGVGEPTRPLDEGEADVWVSHERFLAVLDGAAGRDDIRITFDDGNASDLELGLDALRERDLTATFFVVAGRLGTPGFLDEDGVRRLADAGMQIGCHGMRHRPWRGLGEDELREELVEAKAMLEAVVERPVAEAACPFGSYDRRVLRALRSAGYRRAYTSDRGTTDAGAFLQARNSVGPHDDAGLLGRIPAVDGAAGRRVKLAVKRWR